MEHIDDLISALKTKVITEDRLGLPTARDCLNFLEHAQALAKAASEDGVPTASATNKLIVLLLPNDGRRPA